jgi:hypothetical protein
VSISCTASVYIIPSTTIPSIAHIPPATILSPSLLADPVADAAAVDADVLVTIAPPLAVTVAVTREVEGGRTEARFIG